MKVLSTVYLLLFAGLTAKERRGVLLLVAASSIFWVGYEQAGSALNLFTERYTNRLVGSFEVPTGWFQSVPVIRIRPQRAAFRGLGSSALSARRSRR